MYYYWRQIPFSVESLLLERIETLECKIDPDDTLTTLMTTAGKFLEEMARFKVPFFFFATSFLFFFLP